MEAVRKGGPGAEATLLRIERKRLASIDEPDSVLWKHRREARAAATEPLHGEWIASQWFDCAELCTDCRDVLLAGPTGR